MRKPERWIAADIASAAPGFFPWWYEKRKRWLIVRESPRKVPGFTVYDFIGGRHLFVELVVADRHGNQIELDIRIVEELKRLLQEKSRYSSKYAPGGFNMDKWLKELDDLEAGNVERAKRQHKAMQQDFFRKVYKLLTTETVHLPGKEIKAGTV